MRIIVLQATRSASQAAAEWTMDSWTLVPSAAVAATFAGMLSALSGIGGPPLILMFELLEVPKVSSRPRPRPFHCNVELSCACVFQVHQITCMSYSPLFFK